jgi:hypothetical protein
MKGRERRERGLKRTRLCVIISSQMEEKQPLVGGIDLFMRLFEYFNTCVFACVRGIFS